MTSIGCGGASVSGTGDIILGDLFGSSKFGGM
jgi:hypothetical protein